MKKKLLPLALVLAVLGTDCVSGAGKKGPAEGEAEIWFLAQENGDTGSALGREYRSLPEEDRIEALLSLLFAGPETPELTSPFPQGTGLKEWSLEGETAMIDLSEAYGGLSGADLTLADGCIVLTLCQLSEVERVYLTVEGRPRPFRDQLLSAADFLLENETVAEEGGKGTPSHTLE